MKSYRDLIVWQKSMILVVDVYKLSKSFPDDERFGLTSQLRRCVVSIPSNIAEGYGRNYTKDYVRFLQIARGSLYECQTQIEISVNLEYLKRSEINGINDIAFEIEKMLNSLINKLMSH